MPFRAIVLSVYTNSVVFLKGRKVHNGIEGQGKRKRLVGLIAATYLFSLKLLLPLLGERRNRKSSIVCSVHAKLVAYVKSSFPLGSVDSLPRLTPPPLTSLPANSIHDRARLVHYLRSDCAVAVTLTGC